MNAQPKTLYRSRSNRMVSGVCGVPPNTEHRFNRDPAVVRFRVILFGSLLLVYLVMMIVSQGAVEGPCRPRIPPPP
jgi:phage shock protein PspC (stress-responsive transcriptional regulator)